MLSETYKSARSIGTQQASEIRLSGELEDYIHTSKSKQTKYYTIIWNINGQLSLIIDELIVTLEPQQMIFLTPIRYTKLIHSKGNNLILQFTRDFYCIHDNDSEVSCEGLLFYGASGYPLIHLQQMEQESFQMLLSVMIEEFMINDHIQEEMLRVLLKRWLIKSTRLFKKENHQLETHNPKYETIRQFKIALENNFKENHQVAFYAKKLNRAPKTLSHIFKEIGKKTPVELIHERIISEAKRLLLYSSLSIKEIAYHLGFDNASAFSNLFKKKTKLSPSSFKNMFYK